MKKLITSLFIALTGAAMVACNSGGSSGSGNGFTLSASTNQCSYGGSPLVNTSITYTINGTIPGNQYILFAKSLRNVGDNTPMSVLTTAESSTLTIVATCEYLEVAFEPPANISTTGTTDIFAADITASTPPNSLVQSNSLQYTVNFIPVN